MENNPVPSGDTNRSAIQRRFQTQGVPGAPRSVERQPVRLTARRVTSEAPRHPVAHRIANNIP